MWPLFLDPPSIRQDTESNERGSSFGRASGRPHAGARQANAANLTEGCERGNDLPRRPTVSPRLLGRRTARARGLSFHFSETWAGPHYCLSSLVRKNGLS